MNNHTRNILIVLSILVLVGLAGLGLFLMMIKGSIEAIYVSESSVKQTAATHKQEEELKSLLTKVSPQIDTISTRIIDSNGTVAFINNLESLARDVNATIALDKVEVVPTTSDSLADFEYLSLAVSTQGSWGSVSRLLSTIESLPYKIQVKSVALSQGAFVDAGTASTTSKTTHIWKGTFVINVLKRK